jgi:hypothetical protein
MIEGVVWCTDWAAGHPGSLESELRTASWSEQADSEGQQIGCMAPGSRAVLCSVVLHYLNLWGRLYHKLGTRCVYMT